MTATTPEITALIGGRKVGRDEVIAHEMRRAPHAFRRLRTDPVEGSVAEVRTALLERKLELGRESIKALLEPAVAFSSRATGLMALVSQGRTRTCRTELAVTGITAQDFVDWFHHNAETDNEPAMLAAHPEHYVIHVGTDGVQVVYETLGGSPLVSKFVIDFNDHTPPANLVAPGYPHQISGAAKSDGKKIGGGGALHQFREDDNGFHALLAINFPLLIPPTIHSGHRWHLAIEFSNWIEAAARS